MKAKSIPEVVQTSAMDCGPAALTSLLNGYGMSVSYPRLRELCQTDVDGTSIDTLEILAQRFGLEAEQVMLPNDFIFRQTNDILPAIAVVTLPNGLTHFVVLWRTRFGYVQIMDPARGRSWMRKDRLLDSLYQHRMKVDADDWHEYARSEEFTLTLTENLHALGVAEPIRRQLLETACAAPSWQDLAQLDAAIRMCRSLQRAGTEIRSSNVLTLLHALLEEPALIPAHHYQVTPAGTDGELELTGAVVLRVSGDVDPDTRPDPVLAATQEHTQPSVARRLFALLDEIGMGRMITALTGVSILVGLVTFVEALVFRYLLGAQPPTDLGMLGMITFVVITPLAAAVALDAGSIRMSQAIGRQLDIRLRTMLLHKLPRIADGYFSSRLISDLAERGHAITQVREFPDLLRRTFVAVTRIALLLLGLAWLLPHQLGAIVGAAIFALAAPLAIYPMLAERDMRARTHVGALSRFYLDSLRGTEAIWAHDAATSMQHEHESLLLKWAQAVREFQRPAILFELIQILALAAISISLVFAALSESPAQRMTLGSILLVAYWSLFIPILGRQLTETLKQFPSVNNVTRRVFELLDAPEESIESVEVRTSKAAPGVAIEFADVSVVRGDIAMLENVNVSIGPGEKVAIVGASGSGKTTLLGTILGWHGLRAGQLMIDHKPADAQAIAELREQAVVIDPDLYLWNRSLFESIRYGCSEPDEADFEIALSGSEVLDDLQKMDGGLATSVGENGSRLSGGEGQRLRIARGLVRAGRRLVLLDEPFTGMDTAQRQRMRRSVMQRWADATLLCVSHNVTETTDFERVLVLAGGRVIEDGTPSALLARADSRYASMITGERALQERLRGAPGWQRRVFNDGEVHYR